MNKLLWVILLFILLIVIVIIKYFLFNYESFNLDEELEQSLDQSKINKNLVNGHKQLDLLIKNTNIDISEKIDCPIYYINMDKDTNRNKWMIKQFNKFNIQNYKRISGVDLSKESLNFTSDYIVDENVYNKVYGCLLSHVKCAIELLNENYDFALICEDDVSLNLFPRVQFKLSEFVSRLPKDWDIINLFSLFCIDTNDNDGIIKIYKRKKCSPEKCWMTASYLLSKKGAQNIIDIICNGDINCKEFNIKYTSGKDYPINPVADDYLYDISNTYYCTPSLLYPYNPDDMSGQRVYEIMKYLLTHTPKLNNEIEIIQL